APSLIDVLHLDLLAGHPLGERRSDEIVDLTVEYIAGRRRCRSGPQILYQLVRLKDVAADLMAPADFGLGLVLAQRSCFPLSQFGFVHPSLEHAHRSGAVLVLAAIVLAGNDDPRRYVGNPHGAVGCVDMLAA